MSSPLADALRPDKLSDVVGQHHLIDEGAPLRRIIEGGNIPNLIFYGPSGVGKTTIASIIASKTGRLLRKLNGTTCSTSDLRDIFSETDTLAGRNGILLYLDEIQYLNKKQQQTLLQYIEDGSITLIASTTENPYFYVYSAILSRCTVFEFKPVGSSDILKAVDRAFIKAKEIYGKEFAIDEKVPQLISQRCGGDVRRALNTVEVLTLSADKELTIEMAQNVAVTSPVRYDRDGDEHYDILSAFQKSMRGSDENAALFYLARLLEAGDLISACRRLMVTACEDVGLAYPSVIPIVKAACDMALQLGLPEARIPLADAVILVATSPKSNSGMEAIDAAISDIKAGKGQNIPSHIMDGHYEGAKKLGHSQGYLYPHTHGGWVSQQYLPDDIKDRVYYEFKNNKMEQAALNYRKLQRGK